MKRLIALALPLLLAACGSGGPPPPDWKTDSADLITRYQKHALRGENALAERYFQQAVGATGAAGRVRETARLWLVRCATRRAMLIDDPCAEYTELAANQAKPDAEDEAYFRFVTLRWQDLDPSLLPRQHRAILGTDAARRHEALAAIDDPLARLLDASLLIMRGEAGPATLSLATETASSNGWRHPLLTYLKLQQRQATARGDHADEARLARRIRLVEENIAVSP
ncbi:MAG: hypothetical protein ACYC5S_08015 [Thiobacillus sp.]